MNRREGKRSGAGSAVEQAWRRYIRGHGILGRLSKLLPVEVRTILRRDLTQPIPEAVADVPLKTYVASRREVLEEVAGLALLSDPSSRERYARCLDDGFVCFIGRVDGQLVAYNWTQYKPGEDNSLYVDLRAHEVHTTDAYTAPNYRGRNIHAALLREMLLFSAGLGYRYAYAGIRLTNRRSRKAHGRLGWERTGRALLATWYGGPIVRLSGSVHPWRRLLPGDTRS